MDAKGPHVYNDRINGGVVFSLQHNIRASFTYEQEFRSCSLGGSNSQL